MTIINSRGTKLKVQSFNLEVQHNFQVSLAIRASSIDASDYSPSNATIYENQKKYYVSHCQENSWIKFEFKSNKVAPISYQIMSYRGRQNFDHPKSWVIEGTINDEDNIWVPLDERKNYPDINESYRTYIIQISNRNSEEFLFIRMRLTGLNWHNSNSFIINSFEIYGELI